MPPLVIHSHPLITPTTPLLFSRPSTRHSSLARLKHQNYGHAGRAQGRIIMIMMRFTKTKIIPILVFILCGASVFRFLNLSTFTYFSVSLPSVALPSSVTSPSKCRTNSSASTNGTALTEKETHFISNIVSGRVPCNLLVFGRESEYVWLASLNAGGATVFLEEDDHENTNMIRPNNTRVHKIAYHTVASRAYHLLKDARENPACYSPPEASRCNLALLNLPREAYETTWDVVVVDGPGGAGPHSPGRMGSIYTAGMLARRGGEHETHVVVHDVDRMIEKWFSWEFLCEDNLVSSKGRFWHFKIVGAPNATTFCTI